MRVIINDEEVYKCPLCGQDDPVCCRCVVDGLSAKAEAIAAHDRWLEESKKVSA